jgi:DNA invertase Pin-like site-specific DNA recombinase
MATRRDTDRLSHPRPAAGYIRVSLKCQAEGESPENQRERILQRAALEGYTLILTEEDHDRGGRITRTGYQRILEAARAGLIEAVFVYSLSRFSSVGAVTLDVVQQYLANQKGV